MSRAKFYQITENISSASLLSSACALCFNEHNDEICCHCVSKQAHCYRHQRHSALFVPFKNNHSVDVVSSVKLDHSFKILLIIIIIQILMETLKSQLLDLGHPQYIIIMEQHRYQQTHILITIIMMMKIKMPKIHRLLLPYVHYSK